MSLLTTKTARSMMYLCSIGGLLVLNGFVVMVVWNQFLAERMEVVHHLTFLEGIGITAFAYVIVFSVKYGFSGGKTVKRPPTRTAADRCSEMTADQRAALRAELAQTCGYKESEIK